MKFPKLYIILFQDKKEKNLNHWYYGAHLSWDNAYNRARELGFEEKAKYVTATVLPWKAFFYILNPIPGVHGSAGKVNIE